MTLKNLRFLYCLCMLGLLVIPTTWVFAKSLSSIIINGPGIKGEITLTEPEAMRRLLETGFLFGEYSLAPTPDDPGEGYSMRAYLDLDGPTVPFVELTYYPPLEGQHGLVHYTARLNGEGMQLKPTDDWRSVPSSVAQQVYAVFESQGLTLQPVDLSNSGQAFTVKNAGDGQKDPGSSQNSWTAWVWSAVWIPIAALIGSILKKLAFKSRFSTSD